MNENEARRKAEEVVRGQGWSPSAVSVWPADSDGDDGWLALIAAEKDAKSAQRVVYLTGDEQRAFCECEEAEADPAAAEPKSRTVYDALLAAISTIGRLFAALIEQIKRLHGWPLFMMIVFVLAYLGLGMLLIVAGIQAWNQPEQDGWSYALVFLILALAVTIAAAICYLVGSYFESRSEVGRVRAQVLGDIAQALKLDKDEARRLSVFPVTLGYMENNTRSDIDQYHQNPTMRNGKMDLRVIHDSFERRFVLVTPRKGGLISRWEDFRTNKERMDIVKTLDRVGEVLETLKELLAAR